MSDSKLTTRDMEITSKVFRCFQSPDAMKIDTEKLAQLAGFSNGKSANASWNVIKKKLMAGATVDAGAPTTTPKKAKGKAATIGDADDDDEATSTKAAPKKRGKAVKTEPADADAGDADTEITPSAESPKKGRAKKATGASSTHTNGDATNGTAATEVITPTAKRKRGTKKPKDSDATPIKRAKKGANAEVSTNTDSAADDDNNDAASAQLHGDDTAAQTNAQGSIFGGDTKVKKEESDDRTFDAEEQEMVDDAMADDALFNTYTTEGQVI
ncbi:MAG: hypothetical protein Q9175_005911 [Cornicularia normoerica]